MNTKYTFITCLFLFVFFQSYAQDIEKLANIKDEKPFELSGQVRLQGSYAHISGLDDRTAPYYYGIHSKLKFSFYGVDVPVYLSFRNNSFHYGQNIPRIKINPKYKWAELQIGDTYMKFNEYTLNQRNVRGVAMKLTPGNFRVQAIHGSLRDLNAYRDTLQLGITEIESYSQRVIGMGLGFGNRKNYLDLYLMKAWDNQDSLFYENQNLNQRDNIVVGTTLKLRPTRQLSVTGNFGLSAMTNDINGIGNDLTIGEGEKEYYTVNTTTNISMAWDIGANYHFRTAGINVKIRQIGLGYQPLTVAYLNTNLRNYTVGGFLNALRGKLFINASVGVERNNLNEVNANTTNRLIFNMNSRIKLNKQFDVGLNYANFSQNFEARLININELYTYSVNNEVRSISLQYKKKSSIILWSSRLSFGQNKFETIANEIEDLDNNYSGTFADAGVGLDWLEKGLAIKFNVDRRSYDGINKSNSNLGFGVDVSKDLLDEAFNVAFNTEFHLIDRDGFREGNNLSTRLMMQYRATEAQHISFSVLRIARQSNVSSDFTEFRSQIGISQKF